MTTARAADRTTGGADPTRFAGAGDPLLEVQHLRTYFRVRSSMFTRRAGLRRAVDDVSFSLSPGRTFGLVGESGCGKTTLGRSILRLVPTTAGQIMYRGRDILGLDRAQLKQFRREVQMVFQDPLGSLNPRMTVGASIAEPLLVHRMGGKTERRNRTAEMLESVGLDTDVMQRYPHEFSGGQRQRICVARALITEPRLVILDEPTSALDVTIQAQVLELLARLQKLLHLSYLFISHNLAVVNNFCDEVAVMHRGRIVECGPAKQVFADPQHDYTRSLLSAVPSVESYRKRSSS